MIDMTTLRDFLGLDGYMNSGDPTKRSMLNVAQDPRASITPTQPFVQATDPNATTTPAATGTTMPDYSNYWTPSAWDTLEGLYGQMAQTGRPVDVSGIYGPLQAQGQRNLQETARGLAEQFGLGGLRYSTPLQYQLTQESERMNENLQSQMAQAQIAAQESAMGRTLPAMSGLMNLSNMQWNAPFQLSSSLLGNELTQQQILGLQNQNQMNPWMAYLLSALGTGAGTSPQMYQPNNSIWNILGTMPWGDIIKSFSGGGNSGGTYV